MNLKDILDDTFMADGSTVSEFKLCELCTHRLFYARRIHFFKRTCLLGETTQFNRYSAFPRTKKSFPTSQTFSLKSF